MKNGVLYDGYPSLEELAASPGFPSADRRKKGAVAVIECVQEIPCNPCEIACPFGAICVGEPITNLPVLAEEKCTGCGSCIPLCPGLAITVVNEGEDQAHGTVEFPFEYRPLPKIGQQVPVVDRSGQVVGDGVVLKIKEPKAYDRTTVVTVQVPKALAMSVRSIQVPGQQ